MNTRKARENGQRQAASQKLERLERFLGEDPTNSMLLIEVFQCALQCSDWEKARAHLMDAQTRYPGDAAWVLREADFWLAKEQYDEARTVLDALALIAEPGSPLGNAVAHNLAYVDFCQGDYAACIAKLQPLVLAPSQQPGETANELLQQLWLKALHQHTDLAFACEWASDAELKGQLKPAAAGIASLIAIDHGDFEAAKRWVQLAQKGQQGGSMETLVTQASLALAGRNAEAARKFASQALSVNPEDGRAWSASAFADLLGSDLETARRGFEQALLFMPQHIGTWHGQGWTQVLLHDLVAARASFESALSLDRNFAESHGGLAVVLALGKETRAAQDHIELAQRLDRSCLSSAYAQAIVAGQVYDSRAMRKLAERLLRDRKAPLAGQMSDWLPSGDDHAKP